MTRSSNPHSSSSRALSTCIAIAAGAEGIGAQGIVGADQGCSFEQLIIDDEWLGMISRPFRGIEVTPETLAVEVIRNVGVGDNFLLERHTMRHLRDEIWLPRLFGRQRWDRWLSEGAKDNMTRARERVKGILKEEHPPTAVLDSDIIKQLDEIMKRARRAASAGSLGA